MILLLLVLISVAAQAQNLLPETTIHVPVELVTAPTLVFSSDDRLVFGLDNRNFKVYDDGLPQTTSLDLDAAPVSVVFAVQVNQNVRSYTRFIANVGSTLEALLVGATGEAAVIEYAEDVHVLKPFGSGDVQWALRRISAAGRQARAVDAGIEAIAMLRERPCRRSRILVFIGQSVDSGSQAGLPALLREAERSGVTVFALALPQPGKDFPAAMLSLPGHAGSGGLHASEDLLGRFIPMLRRSAAAAPADLFSALTSATGGTEIRFRQQRQLEDGISLIGVELRSAYALSYAPAPARPGYHSIRVEVALPGAKVYSRPGYWMSR